MLSLTIYKFQGWGEQWDGKLVILGPLERGVNRIAVTDDFQAYNWEQDPGPTEKIAFHRLYEAIAAAYRFDPTSILEIHPTCYHDSNLK